MLTRTFYGDSTLNTIKHGENYPVTVHQAAAEIRRRIDLARIDELEHVWYDERTGLILAHSTGINDRVQQLRQELKQSGEDTEPTSTGEYQWR
jgi:hypothetical protein